MTLDETYERTLREINNANWEPAHRLLQCVAVAFRPLRVEELADLLAFDFEKRPTPTFHEDSREVDPLHAVLSTCSTLLDVVKVGGSTIIRFSHFSVKEFLTSSRLATARNEISRRYHVSMIPAHTLSAQACLGILLHLNKNGTEAEDILQKFPLARYAALHWVDHARFEDVSRNVEDGMNSLLDPSKPHLAVWVSLHNAELPSWKLTKRGERPLPSSGAPLHYATLCGLHAFVKVLVVEHQHDVNSGGFDEWTPLHMASVGGHEEVARILLDGGADAAAQNKDGWTPLHVASFEGHLQVVRILLEHGAPTTAQDKVGSTPLHLALQARPVEDPQVLLGYGADARTEDEDEDGRTPSHSASQIDFLSFLFSQGVGLQLAHDLLQRGVDATDQDRGDSTPLHVGLRHGLIGATSFSVEYEAERTVDSEEKDERIHFASRNAHVEVARILVEHGADVTVLENGADATARAKDGSTPLQLASYNGHAEVARILVEHDADVAAQNKYGWTPLHSASVNGHWEVAQFLVEIGADATAQDKDGRTPLQLALHNGHHIKDAKFLV